jgi:methylphosphotriester-DNA--protein-cysteine methyltransferase
MNKKNLIDVTGLTPIEIGHVNTVVSNLRSLEHGLPVDRVAVAATFEALPVFAEAFPQLLAA